MPFIIGLVVVSNLLFYGGIGYVVYQGALTLRGISEQFARRQDPARLPEAPTNDRVSRSNYDRLRPAMTRGDVEAVLGAGKAVDPDELPGHFRPEDRTTGVSDFGPAARDGRVLAWRSRRDTILVAFYPSAGPDGRLQGMTYQPADGTARREFLDERALINGHFPGGRGRVPSRDLARAFRDDNAAAEKRYKDWRYAVEGAVVGVVPDRPPTLAVRLDGGDGRFVRCLVRPGEEGKAAGLSLGQTVRLTGMCGGVYAGAVTVTDCKVEPVSPDTAERVDADALLAASDGAYAGKFLAVTGGVLVSRTDDGTVIVAGPGSKGGRQIRLVFGREWKDRLARYFTGDPITFRARCKGTADKYVDFEGGWLAADSGSGK
jgi:hypothetical protein